MEERTEIVSVQLDDGTLVKVKAASKGGYSDVLDLEKILPFKEVSTTIEGIAQSVLATLKKVKPDKASIEFGVEIDVESGALTALIAKGSATGNLKITLEWSKVKE